MGNPRFRLPSRQASKPTRSKEGSNIEKRSMSPVALRSKSDGSKSCIPVYIGAIDGMM